MLRNTLKEVKVENEVYKGVVDESGRHITSEYFISNAEYFPRFQEGPQEFVSRCVVLCEESIVKGQDTLILSFPPTTTVVNPVVVIQYGPGLCATPVGKYMVHLSCKSTRTARQDLETVVETLFHVSTEAEPSSSAKPTILYAAYFNLPVLKSQDHSKFPGNFALTDDPTMGGVGCAELFEQAEKIFGKFFPGELFIPKLEEKIWDNEKDPEDVDKQDIKIEQNESVEVTRDAQPQKDIKAAESTEVRTEG